MNRRSFLKNIGTGIAACTISPLQKPPIDSYRSIQLGRVTSESLSVYEKPSELSKILFQRFFNDTLNIYDSIISEDGPGYNPIWHQVFGGYVHSAWVQPVRNRLNSIIRSFPSSGSLMELTVPYSQSYRIRNGSKWENSYILYYGSTHWVFDLIENPYGQLFYEIHNALVTTSHYVPAEHLRLVQESEFAPIHPDVPPAAKHIEISIDFQILRAYENGQLIKEFQVSTGLPNSSLDPNVIPTDTPKGPHIIQNKRPSVHMGDGTLRNDAQAYELPGVPWVSYFEPSTGVAIHGTYWHNNFGVTMSHGCVNMESEDAKWIFRWSTPYPDSDSSIQHTTVEVI